MDYCAESRMMMVMMVSGLKRDSNDVKGRCLAGTIEDKLKMGQIKVAGGGEVW